MPVQPPEYDSWKGTDNPFVRIPGDPGIIRLLILIVAVATLAVAVFSLTHGIMDLYQYLFLLPIVMTAYFFPRYGIVASIAMGLSLVLLNVLFVGENLHVLSLACFTMGVFIGIGGIITMLSENISGLKKRYQDIFAMSEAGIVIFDRDTGHIAEANPGFLAPLGYEYEVSSLPSFCDLFETTEQCRDLSDEVNAGGGPLTENARSLLRQVCRASSRYPHANFSVPSFSVPSWILPGANSTRIPSGSR